MLTMRSLAFASLALVAVWLVAPGRSPAFPEGDKAFTGEIMDSQCASMGSHEGMMKAEGAKDAKDCTLKCVQMGGKFVLYDASNKTTYQLDDQAKAKQFAGQKVKVTGSEQGTKTIHVESISPAS